MAKCACYGRRGAPTFSNSLVAATFGTGGYIIRGKLYRCGEIGCSPFDLELLSVLVKDKVRSVTFIDLSGPFSKGEYYIEIGFKSEIAFEAGVLCLFDSGRFFVTNVDSEKTGVNSVIDICSAAIGYSV